MEDDFVFPDRPADLCDPRCELPLRCADLVDVSGLEREELDEFVDRALYDVCNSDALSLLEQETFDRVYSLVRGYPSLPTVARKRLTDGLCSNLGAVCASAASLLAGGGSGGGAGGSGDAAAAAFASSSFSSSSPAERAAQAALHRAALKAYVFFVSWLQAQADEEDKSASAALTNAAATAANTAAAARGGRKKKNAADGAAGGAGAAAGQASSITWTWDEGRPRVAAAMAALAGVDLRALWRLAASTSSAAANNNNNINNNGNAPSSSVSALAQRVDAGLLSRWVGCSVALLSSQAACRDRALRASLATALGAAAHGDFGGDISFGNTSDGSGSGSGGVSSQLETVAASLVDALRGRDGAHLPAPLAELAASVAASYGGDDRLAAETLRAVAGADPREYEGTSAAVVNNAGSGAGGGGVVPGEGAAAKAAGAFLVELAERMPRTVGGCVALLVPHLGGRAFALRSGIVATMAILVHKAFSDPGEGEGGEDGEEGQGGAGNGDDGGGGENQQHQQQQPRERSEPSAVTRARLRTKQHLLDILLERSRDKNPFTRARVLGAWAYLADRGSLPLGHWNAVAALAAARLEDRVALVRKGALHLLTALMLYNPFGPVLPRERFAASAAEYEAQLRAMEREARERERNVGGGGEAEGGEAAVAAAASNWGETAIKVEGGEAAAAAPAAALAAPAEAEQQEQQDEPMLVDSDDEDDLPPPATLDPAAEQLRALVASLRCAAAFSAQLTAALPTVVQLLASATLSDVTESLAALVCAARFEIDGAEPALRRALLLVFSREAGVPDAAVRAVAELRLAGRAPEAAAASLVELASGATLGELSALDEVMGRLLAKKPAVAAVAGGGGNDAAATTSSSTEPLLRPEAARALWPLAAALGRAALPSAPTRRAALPRLRGCLSLLASLAARAPRRETAAHVPTLLAAGFGVADAACARAAADALSRLGGGGGSGNDADANASPLLSPEVAKQVYQTLLRVLLSPAPTPAAKKKKAPPSATSSSSSSSLGDGGWYGAADASLRALMALHPAPHAVAAEVLRAAAKRALGSPVVDAAANAAVAAEAAEEEEQGGEKQTPPPPSLPPLQAGPLARLLFLSSRVALAQLVAADSNARVARKRRLAAEDSGARAAASAAAADAADANDGDNNNDEDNEEGASDDDDDDLAAIGGGASAAAGGASASSAPASDLDALRDAAEASVLSSRTAPGALAPLVVAACGSRAALAAAPCLRAAAPLALATLAAVDGRACAAHAGALFAAAADAALAARARCSLVVASGDLAARHPNAIEPWTACLYAPLADGNPPEVRRDGLLVLSHLVLNDMVKVRGHGAALAARLADRDAGVAALAALFFHELARRATAKGGNPVYNMLPDVLSSLAAAVVEDEEGEGEEGGKEGREDGGAAAAVAAAAAEEETAAADADGVDADAAAAAAENPEKEQTPTETPSSASANSTAIPRRLSPADFQRIMGVLLSHVGKERQADALVDKLAARMGAEAKRPAARAAAFCLASLALSEKGVRKLMELLPAYRVWCADEEVAASLRAVAARARRLPKAGAALKGDADAWEARVAAAGAEIAGKRMSQEGREGGEGEGEGGEGGDAGEAQTTAERGLSAAVRRMSLVGGEGEGAGAGADDEMAAAAAAAGPPSPPVVDDLDENDNGTPAAAALPARGASTAPALGEAAGNVAVAGDEVTPLGAKHAGAGARGARSVSVAVSAGVGGAAEAMQVTPLRQRRVVSDDDQDDE